WPSRPPIASTSSLVLQRSQPAQCCASCSHPDINPAHRAGSPSQQSAQGDTLAAHAANLPRSGVERALKLGGSGSTSDNAEHTLERSVRESGAISTGLRTDLRTLARFARSNMSVGPSWRGEVRDPQS